ncbi:MAG: hypothetical protein JSU85_01735 [Candidatus Zixiibacteriota bacterium]|nr:MAG: hypothetical protein JSU85_01735 [candidate division Zixibacteria bacterium]
MSLKKDDTLAKCFHPSCPKWIASWFEEKQNNPMFDLLMTLCDDFHKALMEKKTPESQKAYKYLTEKRKIHEKVIEHSLIGIVPKGYRINDKIKKTPGLQRKDYTDDTPDNQPPGSIENLKEILKKARGWIAFFYTDEHHRITSIKFRKPYTGNFMIFKPCNGNTGVFGLGLFTANDYGEKPNLNRELIVVEGEFNQLQLQSLLARYFEKNEKSPEKGFERAIAVGGVSGGDIETVAKISRKPFIFYDNDGAGLQMIKNAKKTISIKAVTTPGSDSDLDSHIRFYKADYESAIESIRGLIKDAVDYYRDIDFILQDINKIRIGRLKEYDRKRQISNLVIDDLRERGRFYFDIHDIYYFNEENKELIKIDSDNDATKLLLANYELNPTEGIYDYAIEEILIAARNNGESIEVRRGCYFDPEKYNLYLNNGNNQIYRITKDSIDAVDNGKDGVLFLKDEICEPFKLVDIDKNESLLDKLFLCKICFMADRLTSTERKLVLLIWFFSLFFESIMPTKPILAFIGEKGSGKSCTAKILLRILYGKKAQVISPPDKQDDFDVILINSYVLALDNADTHSKWLPDRLAIAATGGNIQKRRLYSNDVKLNYPIKCFLIITSRTPHFNRDDVAERMLIMKLERVVDAIGESKRETELFGEIDNNRDRLMSEVLLNLQEIIRILEKEKTAIHKHKFRMSDFADFALKIGNQAGIKPAIERILEDLSKTQSDFTLEDEMLVELLYEFTENHDGEEFSSAELFSKFKSLAETQNIAFLYKTSSGLSRKMKNLRANLADEYTIFDRKGKGNKTIWIIKRI